MRKFTLTFAALCLTGAVLTIASGLYAQVPPQPAPPAAPGYAPPAAPAPGYAPPAAPAPGYAPPAAAAQPIMPPQPTGDLLTDKLNMKKFQTVPQWYPTSAMLKMSLDKGKVQGFQVQLPGPPFCHTYIVSANDQVKNIDMVVINPAGMTESMDSTMESGAIVMNHCPTMPGAYRLNVTMTDGKGEYIIQVFSK